MHVYLFSFFFVIFPLQCKVKHADKGAMSWHYYYKKNLLIIARNRKNRISKVILELISLVIKYPPKTHHCGHNICNSTYRCVDSITLFINYSKIKISP